MLVVILSEAQYNLDPSSHYHSHVSDRNDCILIVDIHRQRGGVCEPVHRSTALHVRTHRRVQEQKHLRAAAACVRSLHFVQGSRRSGKLWKILKTFQSGKSGKIGGFQSTSGKKISNQGTFFKTIFKHFNLRKNLFLGGVCICNKLVFL